MSVNLSGKTLFSIVESPGHPNFPGLYSRLELNEVKFVSMRQAMKALEKQTPDFVVTEFFYGYGSNYAGVNLSNLDVFLSSLQKYAPQARVLVVADRSDQEHVARLGELFDIDSVLLRPVSEQRLVAALNQ
ncbi:MAG: hypothetical protein ACC641_05915 [Acidiferrobacterales bacterium]